MTVMAEDLTRKYNANRHNGAMTALQNVGNLFNNQMTHAEFDGVTSHIIAAQADEGIHAARKAFNEGYLHMLGTILEA